LLYKSLASVGSIPLRLSCCQVHLR
jgi:hypothetical protein